MKKLKTSYKIGNKTYSFLYYGKIHKGKDEVLLDNQDNLLKKTSFNDVGYKVVNFDKSLSHKIIKNSIEKIIKKLIIKYSNNKSLIKNFKLEKYHLYVDSDVHYKIIGALSKGINFNKSISRIKLEKLVSKTLKIKVSTLNKKYKKKNYKYYLDPKKFNLRIIRPSKNDFNPPHRDVYFDNHANGVNIYIPISGSNKKSSLPIFPRSHLINESKVSRTSLNSYFNGVKFSVPVIFKTIPSLKLLRPDPKKNQMMIFSSNLIHGGGLNENIDITRVSLELRFWRI